jgi:hypothetical protein
MVRAKEKVQVELVEAAHRQEPKERHCVAVAAVVEGDGVGEGRLSHSNEKLN